MFEELWWPGEKYWKNVSSKNCFYMSSSWHLEKWPCPAGIKECPFCPSWNAASSGESLGRPHPARWKRCALLPWTSAPTPRGVRVASDQKMGGVHSSQELDWKRIIVIYQLNTLFTDQECWHTTWQRLAALDRYTRKFCNAWHVLLCKPGMIIVPVAISGIHIKKNYV